MPVSLPKMQREAYAESLKAAELEYRTAQMALHTDDSDAARARYARALAVYETIQAQLPLILAGSGDGDA